MRQGSYNNPFLTAPMTGLFLRTALPISLIALARGAHGIVDLYFLGIYVGPTALSAVTLLFPLIVAMAALQSLVANGMSSILARRLGAGDEEGASSVVGTARRLALLACLLLNLAYWTFGYRMVERIAGQNDEVARLALDYMGVVIAAFPITMLFTIEVDRLRCRGRIRTVTQVTLAASALNILLNGVFIIWLGMGTFGSALGSALANLLCLTVALLTGNRPGETALSGYFAGGLRRRAVGGILAFGAPMALGFLGISLSAAALLWNLHHVQGDNLVETVAGYGIVKRILTFTYLPLLGLSLALQAIAGNNAGASEHGRALSVLVHAVITAAIYCLVVESVVIGMPHELAAIFTRDPLVVKVFSSIAFWSLAGYVLFGTVMMVGAYFQAIGDAPRAAVLSTVRTYGLLIPLSFAMPVAFGIDGLWQSLLVSEVAMFAVMLLVLADARRRGLRFGLMPV